MAWELMMVLGSSCIFACFQQGFWPMELCPRSSSSALLGTGSGCGKGLLLMSPILYLSLDGVASFPKSCMSSAASCETAEFLNPGSLLAVNQVLAEGIEGPKQLIWFPIHSGREAHNPDTSETPQGYITFA